MAGGVLLAIATAFVVAVNATIALALLVAAVGVWRSRRPLRRFARDIDRLDRELRVTLPPLPARLADGCDRLQDLNDRHAIAIARLEMAQQAIAIARQLLRRWNVWRKAQRRVR